MSEYYENLIVTSAFDEALGSIDDLTEAEVDAIFDALDTFDQNPAVTGGRLRLHGLNRELAGRWSITVAIGEEDTGLRILVTPERLASGAGVWRVTNVGRHYRHTV